jgi:hypothetical protein
MLLTLPLDAKSLVTRFLVAIRRSFRISSSARCSNAGVTAVVGQPERGSSLSSTWPFSEAAIREAQRLTVLLSPALSLYTFLTACEYSLLIPSPPQEIQ